MAVCSAQQGANCPPLMDDPDAGGWWDMFLSVCSPKAVRQWDIFGDLHSGEVRDTIYQIHQGGCINEQS